MKQVNFDEVKKEVRRICDKFGYDCSFKLDCYIYVYARFNSHSGQIICSSLIECLLLMSEIVFNSVSVEKDGRMSALFYVKD